MNYLTEQGMRELFHCGKDKLTAICKNYNLQAQYINRKKSFLKDEIERAYSLIKNEITNLKKEYYSLTECKELGITDHDLYKKLSPRIIPSYLKVFELNNETNLYLKTKVDELIKLKNNSQILTITEALKHLPFGKSYGKKNLVQIMDEYKFKEVQGPIKCHKYYFKEDILKLKEIINERYKFNKFNRISIKDFEDSNLPDHYLKDIRKYTPEAIDLVYEFKSLLKLYSREDFIKAIEKFNSLHKILEETICEKDVMEKLGFANPKKLETVAVEYNINHLPRTNKYEKKLYTIEDFKRLEDIIIDNYKFNIKYRYTSHQIKELGGTNHDINMIPSIKLKPIDQVFHFQSSVIFYDKTDVHFRLNKPTLKEIDIKEIKDHSGSLFNFYRENYYTFKEIEDIYDMHSIKVYNAIKKFEYPLSIIDIPYNLRKKFPHSKKLILKNEMDDLFQLIIKNAEVGAKEKELALQERLCKR
ncbi:hypothetical protein [Ureibacillus chungkukjangi]|uniref:hypothetical protein n=1 Tax=Ureibacillus chungkukjangi TaxID=1202712 RepID=UPI000D3A5A5F|nr:hypothetical protein [Ureibacillus chungkukjangi]